MSDAYAATLGTVADAYEREVTAQGGKSLSRVATIVASSGAFFNRLRGGCTFNVDNLDRFNAWFRQPANWPGSVVPPDAAAALASMGRPVVHDTLMPHLCGKSTASGHFDHGAALKRGDA